MNIENSQHEYNIFLDKEIQQKLLEADDKLLAKETRITSNLKSKSNVLFGSGNNVVSSNSTGNVNHKNSGFNSNIFLALPLCGWCAEPNVVYRKTESDISSKTRGPLGANNSSFPSRDTKNRSQVPQEFMFRHFTNPRQYIEQYRREHVCCDTTTSSTARHDFLESRRLYACNQYSPLDLCAQNTWFQQNATLPTPQQQKSPTTQSKDQQTAHIIHYTSRQDQQRQTINATFRGNSHQKYQLSNNAANRSETNQLYEQKSNLSDHSEGKEISRRVGSGKESQSPVSGVFVKKSIGIKMNLSSSQLGLPSAGNMKQNSSGSPLDPSISPHFQGHKSGCISDELSRTLDIVECVAEAKVERQVSRVQETINSRMEKQMRSSQTITHNSQPPQLHLTFTCKEGGCNQVWDTPGTTGNHPPTISNLPSGSQCGIPEPGLSRPHFPNLIGMDKLQFSNPAKLGMKSVNSKKENLSESIYSEGTSNSCDSTVSKQIFQRSNNYSDQITPWKELSAPKETDKSFNYISNRWAIAKKYEERALTSHKRRIKHLIEQSKLKSRFGQMLGQQQSLPEKVVLELTSLKISNPFSQPASESNQNQNNNESSCPMHPKLTCDLSSCSSDIGDRQSEVPPKESKAGAQTPKDLQNSIRTKHLCEDIVDGILRNDAIVGKDLFVCAPEDNCYKQAVPGTEMKYQKDRHVKGNNENKAMLIPRTQLYMDKLAEQVSATIQFRVPKLSNFKGSAVQKSRTMNF